MSKAKNMGYEISDGYNILMLKTEEGNYEDVVNLINESRQIDVNAANKKGYTALALAVKGGFADIVELLISKGANVNVRNNSGQSPLFLSCWCNHINLVTFLLSKGAEINTTDQRGWSALTIAAYHGNAEIVQILLENNADVSNQDSFGKRALHRAKDPRIIKMLQMVEAKSGLGTSSNTQRTSTSIILKTDTSTISQVATLKNILSPSTLEIPDAKKNDESSIRKRGVSPSLTLITSPTSRATPKAGKFTPEQTDKKTRKPNISCDQSAFVARSPVKKLSTPVGNKSSLEKILSPKMADARKVKSPNYTNSTPVSTNFSQATEKKEVDDYVSTQMKQASDQLQQIIEQRIAVEVARQVQEYQQKIKEGLESILYTKMAYSFKDLQASFNNQLKTLLSKLGHNQNLEQVFARDENFLPKEIILKGENLKLYNEREINALDINTQKLEKVLGIPKININTNNSLKNGKALENKGAKSSNSRNSLGGSRGEIKSKTVDQVNKELRINTETLSVYSKDKISETVQNEAKTLQKNVWDDINSKLENVEAQMKKKFEGAMANKFAYLSEMGGNNYPYSEDLTEDESFQDRQSSSETKTLSQNTLKGLRDSELIKESSQNSANTSVMTEVAKPLVFPKIEKVTKSIETPPKYSFAKSEKTVKSLDSVEEIDSQKETLPDLKDNTPITLRGGLIMEGFTPTGRVTAQNTQLKVQEEVIKKKEDEKSLSKIPSLSDAGDLSAEYRLEGLKRFYGKAAAMGGSETKQTKPRSSAKIDNANVAQVSPNGQIPGHYFSFAGPKGVIQYDFNADE